MSLFKLPTPHTSLSRNGYDLSSKKVFSAPIGALIPIGTWEVNPGEKFKISVQDLVRTQPLNTAAFARLKEYYHFFFVPYKSLWQHSDRFFTGVTEGDSAFKKPETNSDFNFVPKSVPTTSMRDLLYFLHASNTDFMKIDKGLLKAKYDLVKSNPDAHSGTFGGDINFDDLVAKEIELPEDLKKYHSEFLKSKLSTTDALGYSYKLGAFRLLHHLGYGVDNNGLVPMYGKFN